MKYLNAVGLMISALLCTACAGLADRAESTPLPSTIPVIRTVVDPQSERFLQEMVAEERFSGVALVMKSGKLVHVSGYGNATDGRLNTVDTAFHVASITKQFTAAAILQLVEKGMIDPDASVNAYLPQQYRSPNWWNVSIHHLLSHSSGITDYALTRDYYDVVDGFCLGDTVDGMVAEAMAKELEFEPGSRFAYSNIGFTLLGLVIESRSLVPYDEYLTTHILKPMGMTSSRAHIIGHVPTAQEAAGHRWNVEAQAHAPDDVVTLPVTAPDGGLVTTLSDFVKWAAIFMDGRSEVLQNESLSLMTSAAVPIDVTDGDHKDARGNAQSYGYGLFVGDGLISHSGYIVGFRSHFLVDQEERSLIVVFSNNTTNDPKRIATGLLRILDSPAA